MELLGWVCRRLLTGNTALNAFKMGAPSRFDRVPPHKRLAHAAPECGLAIGNLSSQFFANVYLDVLDQFVKHHLKCRHYLRYVDDFVLLSRDPAELLRWHAAIVVFLRERLNMTLRDPQALVKPVSQGVDFLGYIVRPNYLLPRRRVVQAANSALARWERRLKRGDTLMLSPANQSALASMWASYAGHFRHAAHHRVWQRLLLRYPWLPKLAGTVHESASGLSPPLVSSLLSQQTWFAAAYPGRVVWLQVGSSWECYDEHARAMADRYQLSLCTSPRVGFNATLALPARTWQRWLARFSLDGVPFVAAQQYGRVPGHRHGLRKRQLVAMHPFAT